MQMDDLIASRQCLKHGIRKPDVEVRSSRKHVFFVGLSDGEHRFGVVLDHTFPPKNTVKLGA